MNDIGSLTLEGPIYMSGHAVIRMRMSLQGLIVSDKYGRNLSRMDKGRLLGSCLLPRQEVQEVATMEIASERRLTANC